MSVAIIDYGSGNLHSAHKAFERAAREAGVGETIAVTSDPAVVAGADRIVLPGVGTFADCRRGLDGVPGMVDALTEAVRRKARPFFGIRSASMRCSKGSRPARTGFTLISCTLSRSIPKTRTRSSR